VDTLKGLRGAARQARECTHDLGACCEHEITLKEAVPGDHSQDYPVRVEFRGRCTGGYWCEEEPVEPAAFGLNVVSRRLAALGREPA
jgi:hypothetical protein